MHVHALTCYAGSIFYDCRQEWEISHTTIVGGNPLEFGIWCECATKIIGVLD